MKNIQELSEYINKLSPKDQELFSRIYTITDEVGKLKIPQEMKPWVTKTFGSVSNVETQKIIRIDNKITYETALYNELRNSRPIQAKESVDVNKVIKDTVGGPFCTPTKSTPADTFGRIKGIKCITASNIAKFDSSHGIIIFNEHNPLKITSVSIKDYLETATKWIKKANKEDKKRNYPYITWNCLWKSAASIIHGHMQITLGQNHHYGEIELLRRLTDEYISDYGTDYFSDLFKIHKKIGLGIEYDECKIIVNLSARKEKEVMIIAKDFKESYKAIHKVLRTYFGMGVQSFNMGAYLSPIDKSWSIPIIIRFVDRMSLNIKSSDIGSVEMFARTRVIASDPYKVMKRLKQELK